MDNFRNMMSLGFDGYSVRSIEHEEGVHYLYAFEGDRARFLLAGPFDTEQQATEWGQSPEYRLTNNLDSNGLPFWCVNVDFPQKTMPHFQAW